MRLKIYFITLFFLTSLFGLFFPKTALADTFTLSGHISDSSNNAVSNADVSVAEANTNINAGNTTTDSSGNYNVILIGGAYNVKVTPPAGSNFSSAIALSQNIASNTTLNFVLTPAGTVTLSGHVYDPLGNPLANQTVYLLLSGQQTTAITDASGSYSLQVSTGTYVLHVTNTNNSLSIDAPQYYDLAVGGFSLTASTVLDITLPAKKVIVHIQDAVGNPVSNAEVDALTQSTNGISGLSIGGGITANGKSFYGFGNTGPLTDALGDATLWLFPNPNSPNATYNFTVKPPTGSIYSPFILNNIIVTGDQTELISLQYSHPSPITTAALSPISFPSGEYSDPTTVTLTATAEAGYAVTNTYYKIDNGSQQTYASPFTVIGAGSHTVHYWSKITLESLKHPTQKPLP